MCGAKFMAFYTIVMDAGHGGSDYGAVYNGRNEKDDTLALTLAVGNILQNAGINVVYTRTDDVYETPYRKAQEGNLSGADYFISIHRNSSPYPNTYSGVESLIYSQGGVAEIMARNIDRQLSYLGFRNIGVSERPNLIVLNSTQMPAVLVEVGFINTDRDNALFDLEFEAIAEAIAYGILETIGIV